MHNRYAKGVGMVAYPVEDHRLRGFMIGCVLPVLNPFIRFQYVIVLSNNFAVGESLYNVFNLLGIAKA